MRYHVEIVRPKTGRWWRHLDPAESFSDEQQALRWADYLLNSGMVEAVRVVTEEVN